MSLYFFNKTFYKEYHHDILLTRVTKFVYGSHEKKIGNVKKILLLIMVKQTNKKKIFKVKSYDFLNL